MNTVWIINNAGTRKETHCSTRWERGSQNYVGFNPYWCVSAVFNITIISGLKRERKKDKKKEENYDEEELVINGSVYTVFGMIPIRIRVSGR